MQPTCTIGLYRGLIDYLRRCGVEPAPVLNAGGLDEAALERVDERLPVAEYWRAIEHGAELTGDADFGLHLGAAIRPGDYGVVGLLAMSQRRSGDLMDLHCRYQGLVAEGVSVRYETAGDEVRLIVQPTAGWPPGRHAREVGFAAWVTLARWLTGAEGAPLRVEFVHAQPESTGEHSRVFGCPVMFDRPQQQIVFPRYFMELPLPQANPELIAPLQARADRLLAAAGGSSRGKLQVSLRRAIADALPSGVPDIETMAASLHLSTRSLQRKLAAEGTSFADVLDGTRHELAIAYARDETLSLTEIAFLLGFNQQSSFTRAFRRWTGQSPSGFRAAVVSTDK